MHNPKIALSLLFATVLPIIAAAIVMVGPTYLPLETSSKIIEAKDQVYVLIGVTTCILIITYTYQVLHNQMLSSGAKAAWAVAFVVASWVAMPTYWFRFIAPKRLRVYAR